MKLIYFSILSIFVFISCNDKGAKDNSYLPKSVGKINYLQVITPNNLWNGEVGEEIRKYFATPTDGLPQDEPTYSINQMPPETYSGFARKNRLVLYANLGDKDNIAFVDDKYAKPQSGVFITSKTKEGLVKLIAENHEKISQTFYNSEISKRQSQTNVSLLKIDSLKERLGVTLKIPSAYRVAKSSDDFYWLRKDLKSGTTNIIIYEVPVSMIRQDSLVMGDIIKLRDSIGGSLMPVEDEGRFQTDDSYPPYLVKSEVGGKFAYETKGIWEVSEQYMGGPFINYAIYDEKNNRYLILEGFSYAPSVAKRDLQFELESILKSATLY